MESSQLYVHEEHIAGKGFTSMTHYNLVDKFIPMPQAMKILDANAAVDKEWKKLETIPARQLENVKSKNEVILEAHSDKTKVHLAYTVFNEQGSSASQMTAAEIMDVIARLPDCDRQAAVSAYTQVKVEDAPKLLKIPKSECPDVWIRHPRRIWPRPWRNSEDPMGLPERSSYGHPLAGLQWERQFEEA